MRLKALFDGPFFQKNKKQYSTLKIKRLGGTNMSFFESPLNVSVGCIESVRVNKKNRVKYEIAYPDKNGKERVSWSNWMRDNGYAAGDHIPVESKSIPWTFGLCSKLTEVNGVIQHHKSSYVVPVLTACVGTLVAGYFLGKKMSEN